VSSDITVHRTKEGVKGSKKRCKKHHKETMTHHDDNNDGEVGSLGMRCISTVGSLTCGVQLNEDPGRSDTTPFHWEVSRA
jgi:hypothetical protein